jgi:ABC-type antimicrobial peptide transport system permease subunit
MPTCGRGKLPLCTSRWTGPRIVTTVVIRTEGDPVALASAVRHAILAIDPNQPIRSIAPLSGVMAESIARDRFFTILFAVFGGLAMLLAAVGVYGVLAYSVGQRTQEIGVRMAFGARAADIRHIVLGGGMRLVCAGVAVGAIAAVLLTRVLASQLYGISATDPITFVLAASGLATVALLASMFPHGERCASNPMAALREE